MNMRFFLCLVYVWGGVLFEDLFDHLVVSYPTKLRAGRGSVLTCFFIFIFFLTSLLLYISHIRHFFRLWKIK